MKPLLLFLCSTLLSLSLLAQVESLEKELGTADRDTARVNILNKLATLYFNSAPEKAHDYMNKALNLADSLHYGHGGKQAGKHHQGKKGGSKQLHREAVHGGHVEEKTGRRVRIDVFTTSLKGRKEGHEAE